MKTCGVFVFLVIVFSLVLPESADLHAASAQPAVALTASTSDSRASVTEWPATSGPDAAMDDPTCPNLVVDPGEDCDDANLENGDGCDSTCHFEPPICGNGVLDTGEVCDDGNLMANDGCDAECNIEPSVCGNGLLEPDEECDDKNLASGDGCDGSCHLEGATGIVFSIGTSTTTDTLYAGVPGSLIFNVQAPATTVMAGFTFPMKYSFSNRNIIGPIGKSFGTAYMTYSPKAHATVNFLGWNQDYAVTATNPAYTLLGLLSIPIPHPWTGSGELWRITFIPLDTGTITIDTTSLPPSNHLLVFDTHSEDLPCQWQGRRITVVAGMPTGNVNGDGIVSSSDLVYLVNFLYKQGAPPAPCEARGDVDCSGIVNALDIMRDINYVFKSGQKPCNVGGLVGAGVWECP